MKYVANLISKSDLKFFKASEGLDEVKEDASRQSSQAKNFTKLNQVKSQEELPVEDVDNLTIAMQWLCSFIIFLECSTRVFISEHSELYNSIDIPCMTCFMNSPSITNDKFLILNFFCFFIFLTNNEFYYEN